MDEEENGNMMEWQNDGRDMDDAPHYNVDIENDNPNIDEINEHEDVPDDMIVESDEDNDQAESDDSDEEENSNFFNVPGGNLNLFPITFKNNANSRDLLLLQVAQSMKFKTTYEQLLSNCQMFNMLLENADLPVNKKQLWERLGRNNDFYILRSCCESCLDYVGVGDVVERECTCGTCRVGA